MILSRAVVLAIVGMTVGCLRISGFTCVDSDACDSREGGVCTPAGICAYPDDACGSSLRYDRQSGGALAGECVEVSEGTAATGSESTGSRGETEGASDPTQGDSTGQGPGSDAGTSGGTGSATGTGEETGEICGSAGGPCCAGSVCDPGLHCTGDTCGCVEQLVTGDRHSCALLTSGELYCWGSNEHLQLGVSTEPFETSPVLAQPSRREDPIVEVSAANHTCVRHASGVAACWGANPYGQVSADGATPTAGATPVTWVADTTRVAAGLRHSCASGSTGVLCWGDNAIYQLSGTAPGPGPFTPFADPVPTVVLGDAHSCVVRDGIVLCWGDNRDGVAGGNPANGSTRTTPTRVQSELPTIVGLAAGRAHTCAGDADGQVFCWGRNEHGQLGNGGVSPSYQALQVPLAELETPPAQVVAGGNQACVVTEGGELWCWGSNEFGQLMLTPDEVGFDGYSTVPVRMAVGAPVVTAATGGTHTCALTYDSKVVCWGSNTFGQIGDGTRNYALRPREVALSCR